jgi:hypothetical protein
VWCPDSEPGLDPGVLRRVKRCFSGIFCEHMTYHGEYCAVTIGSELSWSGEDVDPSISDTLSRQDLFSKLQYILKYGMEGAHWTRAASARTDGAQIAAQDHHCFGEVICMERRTDGRMIRSI